MKLHAAHTLSLVEAAFLRPLPILEAGEGPQWSFNYTPSSTIHDPSPKILMLGAYQHPNTGNNLVGGVNLNYLDKPQRDQLARVLPKIMQAPNLYQRYHAGRQLLPQVFNNFYRTYNAAHIRGVEQGVVYPKYGMFQTAQNLLKKTFGGLFKSKAQRAKDAEPQFPQDLSNMRDTLDQTVQSLQQQAQRQPIQPDTPEMQVARQAFQQFKLARAQSMMDVERQELEPFLQATQQFQANQVQQGAATPSQVPPSATRQAITKPAPQPTPTSQQMGQAIQRERQKNQQELQNPQNSLDLDGDGVPDDLQEAIVYYCPITKQYVMENVATAIRHDHQLQGFLRGSSFSLS